MRLTILLPDRLVAEAKRYAAAHKRTLNSVIEESLRRTLSGRKGFSARKRKTRVPTFKGNGLQPGVDPIRLRGFWT